MGNFILFNLIKGDVTNLAVDAITKEMKYESFAE